MSFEDSTSMAEPKKAQPLPVLSGRHDGSCGDFPQGTLTLRAYTTLGGYVFNENIQHMMLYRDIEKLFTSQKWLPIRLISKYSAPFIRSPVNANF